MSIQDINLGTSPLGADGDDARTAFKKVNANFAEISGLQQAFSAANFEANRRRNKEFYVASGFVTFGNHVSGSEVNPCKPGLYTSLTTTNRLLIGKSGGVGGSRSDKATVHIDGVLFELPNAFVLDFQTAPDVTLPMREDIYGLQAVKVEITLAAPSVYQAGITANDAINFSELTVEAQKAFLAANSNTTYIDENGKLYQWQLTAVSFAGLSGATLPSDFGYTQNSFGDLWTNGNQSLLQLGTANRLNQGAYHLSFNPSGSAKFAGDTYWYNTSESITSTADCFDSNKILAGSGTLASGKSGRLDKRYHDVIYADGFGGVCRDMRYSAYEVEERDFAEADLRVKNGSYRGFEKAVFTKVLTTVVDSATAKDYGRIPVSASEVIRILTELGLPNSGTTIEFFSQNMGVYLYNPSTGYTINARSLATLAANNSCFGTYLDKDDVSVLSDRDEKLFKSNINGSRLRSSSGGKSSATTQFFATTGDTIYVIATQQVDISVGGSYSCVDVFANPSIILASPDFANGWLGGWAGIPSGDVEFTRKNVGSTPIQTYFTGSNWLVGDMPNFNAVVDGTSGWVSASSYIYMFGYQAFSEQTEAIPLPTVYKGILGIGKVWQYGGNYIIGWGVTFAESLLKKVCKSSITSRISSHLSIIDKVLRNTGALDNTSGAARKSYHAPISLPAPDNSSVGVKAADFNIVNNNQAFKAYCFTELVYSGSDWGDDSMVDAVPNESVKPNDNGNVVKVGTHKLKEPIGWIKGRM